VGEGRGRGGQGRTGVGRRRGRRGVRRDEEDEEGQRSRIGAGREQGHTQKGPKLSTPQPP